MALEQTEPSFPAQANIPHLQRHPYRRLQRENAVIILTPAEQALADFMVQSSSPPPENPSGSTFLGKRARSDADEDSGEATEPDTNNPTSISGTIPQAKPFTSRHALNHRALTAVRRYASTKRLRTEQRDQVEDFLMVSGRRLMHLL